MLVKFVEAIAASPTVRLDVSPVDQTTGLQIAKGYDFPPPPVEYAVSSTLLADGGKIAASTYGLRTVTLQLAVPDRMTANQRKAELTALARELDRERNVLLVQANGATEPRFLRTFRASIPSLSQLLNASWAEATVTIPAEPFAFGERVTDAVAVNNNPVDAEGLWFDVTVAGDVETPLHLQEDGGTVELATRTTLLATRRRGVVANGTFFQQGEALLFTTGFDTTRVTGASTTTYSNGGYATTSFSGTPGDGARLSGLIPDDSVSVADLLEIRGRYRVYARVRKTVGGDVVNVSLKWAGIQNDPVTLPASSTSFYLLDLGEITTPAGTTARSDGYGADMGAKGLFSEFRAQRVSGSGALEWDFFFFVPADQELCHVKWPVAPNANDYIYDGPNDECYHREDAAGTPYAIPGEGGLFIERDGFLPMLSPGIPSRVFFSVTVGPELAHVLTSEISFVASWWPRYLSVI